MFLFIEWERANFPVTLMCRVLGVSTSGYYAWRRRPRSARAEADAALVRTIREIHEQSDGTYGSPRIHAELADDHDTRVGRKRVARLMRRAGIVGVHRRKGVKTTRRGDQGVKAPDLLRRDFTADAPDRAYVADITYVPTWAGFVFLAVVLDVFTRRIVGWSMSNTLHAKVVLDALEMAIHNRGPAPGAIHHSDHGAQYTSLAFGSRLREAGLEQSLGSIGDCYDNALCEAFFASLECELLDLRTYRTRDEARLSVFRWIEGWYNARRRHSALGQRSPAAFEAAYRMRLDAYGEEVA